MESVLTWERCDTDEVEQDAAGGAAPLHSNLTWNTELCSDALSVSITIIIVIIIFFYLHAVFELHPHPQLCFSLPQGQ